MESPIGLGHSSPILWGDRIFLTSFKNETLWIHSILKENGGLEWSQEKPYAGPKKGPGFEELHDTNPAAFTLCADEQRVYSYGLSVGLTSYDHLGNEIWHQDFEPTPFLYGTEGSPMVHMMGRCFCFVIV